MISSTQAAKKEYIKRLKLNNQVSPIILEDILFKQQLEFVKDQSPFKVAVCSRRAGKSTGVAGDLVETAFTNPNCTSLYITGTRGNAKKIIWSEALKFNREHNLGGKPNISELTISFNNGSIVRLAGAKDETEIEKLRGQLPPIKKVFIDECQSIRDRVLVKLIDDVLEASLMDYAAPICITGTPGSIPTGYFYQISHNLDKNNKPLRESAWSVHNWTFFDNPHIPLKSKTTHKTLLNRVLKRRGVTIEDPSIQREFFGKWVTDTNSLLVHYNEKLNHYDEMPKLGIDGKPIKWSYILGIDIGFNDADALALLAWSEASPNIYLIEERLTKKQDITDLVKSIEDIRSRYDVSKLVIDAGALGKKISEELIRRHKIPLMAADKQRKMENVALLNDWLRTGKFKAKSSSSFAQDSFLVEIDRDKSTPDKIKVSDRYHSDIIDAVLYAFKESFAYTYQPVEIAPKWGTKEWAARQNDEMFQKELEGLKEEQNRKFEENWAQNAEWWKEYID